MTVALTETRARETELLANLRHDLRTPITVIIGFSDALADGTATGEDAGRAARAIAEEAARLERLVSELGAMERLRSGAAGLRPERIDAPGGPPGDRRAVRPRRRAARAWRSSSSGRPRRARPTSSFAADRLAVDRMLGNLVANAIVGRAAAGRARLARRPTGRAGRGRRPGSVALSVTDDGPGFPPGATERAFERFYRGDPARSGSGSGLGLAIVRELAEAHGGHRRGRAGRPARRSGQRRHAPRAAPFRLTVSGSRSRRVRRPVRPPRATPDGAAAPRR